jgi:hypothetical protein
MHSIWFHSPGYSCRDISRRLSCHIFVCVEPFVGVPLFASPIFRRADLFMCFLHYPNSDSEQGIEIERTMENIESLNLSLESIISVSPAFVPQDSLGFRSCACCVHVAVFMAFLFYLKIT